MSDCWDNITTGMKVEVENFDCDNFSEDFPNSFWVATVLKVSGKFFSKEYFMIHCNVSMFFFYIQIWVTNKVLIGLNLVLF